MSCQRLGWFAERMIKSTPIATINLGAIIGAMLAALLLGGGHDRAVAGPVAAATPSPDAAPPAVVPHARVYLFRGDVGQIFSRGVDHLAERIEQVGITADVYEFTICRFIAAGAIREYRE